jgi:DNA primase
MITKDIQQYREIPIHRLVGDTRLNRKVKIRCPFHAENTPSCNLFPTGGFKCYGCGAHGNTVDFVMKLGATFEEALEELNKYI